jgi:hypothetical protein
VDKDNQIFGVQGNQLNEFSEGDTISVIDAGDNNGDYTVSALSYENRYGNMKYNGNEHEITHIWSNGIEISGDPFNLSDQDEDNDEISEGDEFEIIGSKDQDGEYEVRQVSYSDGITTINTIQLINVPRDTGITYITVQESIPSSSAEGNISYAEQGIFELWLGTPYKVQSGDSYKVYPGCNKFKSMCKSKFNNVINFRGMDMIPGRDEVSKYPDAKS